MTTIVLSNMIQCPSMKEEFSKASTVSGHQKHIAVVGSGAIGRTIASMLALSGKDVSLYGRDESVRKLSGLTFQDSPQNTPVAVPAKLLGYGEIEAASPKPDVIFYSVKAGHLKEALQKTQDLIGPDTRVVFLQGGVQWWMGHGISPELGDITDHQGLKKYLSMDQIYAGLISFGASLSDTGAAVLNGRAPIVFGSAKGIPAQVAACTEIANLFSMCPCKGSITKTLSQDMWNKAVGSLALSVYGLITGQNLGDMMQDAATLKKMVSCSDFLKEVGKKLGFQNDKNYEDYFKDVGASIPLHKMSITKDPGEFDTIIRLPLAVAEHTGFDVSSFDDLLVKSSAAAARIKSASAAQNAQKAMRKDKNSFRK